MKGTDPTFSGTRRTAPTAAPRTGGARPEGGAAEAAHRLEAVVARLAAHRGVGHVAFAVRRGDGSFLWRGAAGVAGADGAPMTVGTPYFVASIDKLLIATAAFRLAEDGRLDLDARLVDVLDTARVARLHVRDGIDRTQRLTVRHLLTHTSGLADHLEDRPPGGRSLVDELLADGDRSWSDDEAIARVRERLRPHFPPQDLRDPRARARYSDTNYLLLGQVVAAAAGRPVEAALRALVLEPLGLHATFVTSAADPKPERTAGAAAPFAAGRPLALPRALAALRSVYATLDDQLALVRAFVDGRPFADPGTFARMAQGFRRFGPPRDAAALRQPSWPIEYAHGVMRFRTPAWLPPFRRRPTVLGHTGSTGSWAFHCPELDLDLVGSVDEVSAGPLPFRALASWFDALAPLGAPAVPSRAGALVDARVAG